MNRTVVCLLLLGLSSVVNARDVRMHGPNGDGSALVDSAAIAAPPPTKHDATTTVHARVKTPPLFRSGDDDGGSRAPRWHSFLPGMFR